MRKAVSKVLFFNGAGEQVADIFLGMRPDGFDADWKPSKVADDEKKDGGDDPGNGAESASKSAPERQGRRYESSQ